MEKIFLARTRNDFHKSKNHPRQVSHFYLKEKEHLYEDRSRMSRFDYFKTEKLTLGWFKDDSGNDVSSHEGISWGNILASGLIRATAYSYREYIFLKNFGPIAMEISDKEDLFFQTVAKHTFKENLKIYSGNVEELIIDTTIKRNLQFPRVNWKFWLLSLTSFFKLLFKPSFNLVIADGATIDYYLNKKDFLFLNTRFFSKSLYFNYKRDENLIKKITPDWIFDKSFYYKQLTEYNLRNGQIFDDCFISSLSEIFVLHAQRYIEQIQDWICYYLGVFAKFHPLEVHFPGEMIEFYSTGIEVANFLGIKTVLVRDGISTLENTLFLKKPNGEWIFDKYVVFSESVNHSLLRVGVSKDSLVIENTPHPMVSMISSIQQKIIYDVVIFTWIPYEYNPFCFPDLLPKILEETIVGLKGKNLKIAIKFKNNLMKELYANQMSDEVFNKVDVFTGSPSEVLPFSKTIITGASTAIFEAMALGKKIILFEPPENGYFEEILNQDLLKEFKFYSTTKEVINEFNF